MGALYDVMGKHLEVPAYKLMGQKVRNRVPVAAWTRQGSPEDLAAEVQRAVAQGYMIFKVHTCAYYDVLEQNAAVEAAAPPGFKMHYDFNHNRQLMAVLPNVSHSTNLDDQYEEDVTVERIPVVEGSSPVPEKPGLGVEVDEAALQRVAANSPTEIPRHVGILHLPGGHNLYTPSFASVSRETGFPEGAIRGIRQEIWDDDGSEEFARLHERVHQEGPFLE